MDFLNIYVKILGFIHGTSMYIIRDVNTMKKIMKNSTVKGETGLEQLLSKKNWLPISSVESEDGQKWVKLREYFDTIYNNLKWREKLPLIIKDICLKYKYPNNTYPNYEYIIIDSHIISACVAEIMIKLLFDYDCDQNEIDLLVKTRDEYAKTLSLHGSPNNTLRSDAFDFIKKLVSDSNYIYPPCDNYNIINNNLYDIIDGLNFKKIEDNLTENYLEFDEWVSVFFQPFIISPMINISDLFSSLPKFLYNHTNKRQTIYSDKLLVELMDFQHPFPILERISTHSFDNIKKGDHVLFAADDLEKTIRGDKPGIRFGNGYRGCPGQNLAIMLFQGMVRELYNDNESIFKPSVNHFYSGRTNDCYSYYKIKSLFNILCIVPKLSKYFKSFITSFIIIYIIKSFIF